MRITFVTPQPGFGGGIRAVAMYADQLAKRGHQVAVVSAGPKMLPWSARVKNLLKGKGWWRPPGGESFLDTVAGIRRRNLSTHRPVTARDLPDADVVIATWWETAEWIAALPASKGKPVYFVQHHEVVFNNQPRDRVAATYRLPMAKICCAQWLKTLMADEYGDATAEVVPYGIDHDVFHAPPRSKQDRPTVGFMYARATFKGTDIAIRACELAREKLPGLRVIAFGETASHEDCPLPDWVELETRPGQDRIAQMYASCDAWLFASRCEGFGLPILEAMACRTPVIGTPTGIAPDVLPEGGGRLVKPEDAQDMADAIVAVSSLEAARWQRLSDAAVATAGRFRWDVAAAQFEACLRRLVM